MAEGFFSCFEEARGLYAHGSVVVRGPVGERTVGEQGRCVVCGCLWVMVVGAGCGFAGARVIFGRVAERWATWMWLRIIVERF